MFIIAKENIDRIKIVFLIKKRKKKKKKKKEKSCLVPFSCSSHWIPPVPLGQRASLARKLLDEKFTRLGRKLKNQMDNGISFSVDHVVVGFLLMQLSGLLHVFFLASRRSSIAAIR